MIPEVANIYFWPLIDIFVPGPPWGQQCGRSSLQVQHTYPRSVLQGGARARVPQLQREGSTQHDITLNIKKKHHEEEKSPKKSVQLHCSGLVR